MRMFENSSEMIAIYSNNIANRRQAQRLFLVSGSPVGDVAICRPAVFNRVTSNDVVHRDVVGDDGIRRAHSEAEPQRLVNLTTQR